MYKILTYNNISIAGLERFPRDRYEVASEIQHPDAIMLRSFKLHGVPIAETVRCIGRAGAGVNNIPVDDCSKRGIPVFNAPGANANAVKELVVAGMLLAARNICPAWDFGRGVDGDDKSIDQAVEQGKKNFAGTELAGKTLGVIGLGAIGVRVANTALALGMNVIGFDPQLTVDSAWQLSSSVQKAAGVDDLVSRSDYVTVHVPLNDHTRHLISGDRIELMKTGSVILNFSRSGIVEDAAAAAALDSGKLRAYVSDFPCNALLGRRGVILLPHLGASTEEAEDNCAVMIADQLRDYLENGNIRNSVNFPNVEMPRGEGFRLGVINENVPNMVGQISAALAAADLNILDLLNRSRGDYAYTLLDVSAPIPAKTLVTIGAIKGVLAVRAI